MPVDGGGVPPVPPCLPVATLLLMRRNYFTLNYDVVSSSWNNCSTNVHREGCTLDDVFIEVLSYPHWSQFNTNDVKQQRYREVIDSLQHLCNNMEPGTNNR